MLLRFSFGVSHPSFGKGKAKTFIFANAHVEYYIDYYYINATDFEQYLEGYHDTFQLPIWVTEWACANFVR